MPGPGSYVIAPACIEDLGALGAIETAATALFEGWGVEAAVHAGVTSIEELRDAQRAGLLWIARATDRRPVGFALVELLGGQPHLEEIDVHPAHGRRGIGTALVNAVLSWARDAGYHAVTLTTFLKIPWNAPFYERLGFRVLDAAAWSPELEAIVRDESSRGLDPAQRVVMRCAVGGISTR
jgi:GNAT superfamily N-acetyltransferase